MGLFDRFKGDKAPGSSGEKVITDEMMQTLRVGKEVQDAAMAANPSAVPAPDAKPEELQAWADDGAAYAQRAKRVHDHGVEAPAIIRAIRATDTADLAGGRRIELDVSIQLASGELREVRIEQHMVPAQSQRLTVGQSVTVKHDPGAPDAALLYDW